MIYRIRILGTVDQNLVDWLGGGKMASEQDENGSTFTLLTVDLIDQPALFGVLEAIRDLNLTLISVNLQVKTPA